MDNDDCGEVNVKEEPFNCIVMCDGQQTELGQSSEINLIEESWKTEKSEESVETDIEENPVEVDVKEESINYDVPCDEQVELQQDEGSGNKVLHKQSSNGVKRKLRAQTSGCDSVIPLSDEEEDGGFSATDRKPWKKKNSGTMSSYHDTELLIAEIQSRSILWDSSTEDYKDKNKKAEAWIEVCRSLSAEYEEKSTTEKYKLEKELQARWKSLRDSYTKSCKKQQSETRSGSRAVKSRRYIFSDQLSFLRKVTENRTTADSLSSAQKTEEVIEVESKNLATAQLAAPSEPTKRKKISLDDKVIKFVEGHEEQRPSEHTKRKISLEERMIKFMEGNEEQRDADKDFFMSMLPSVRTLNEDQKMEFRMQVILALRNVKSGRYGHSVNLESHPSSNTFPSVQHQ